MFGGGKGVMGVSLGRFLWWAKVITFWDKAGSRGCGHEHRQGGS